MKKKNMKPLFLSVAFISSALLAACSGDVPTQPSAPDSIRFNNDKMNLVLGDTSKLIAYTPDTGKVITWTSTNEDVVKVNSDGSLEAITSGEATIIGSYGDAKASCQITVSSGLLVPSLKFENEISENEKVAKGGQLNLNAYISFNGKRYDDALIDYSVTNTLAGTVRNGIFTAGNTLNETAQIIVTANWRNFNVPSFRKIINVTVSSIRTIYLNEGSLSDINLYTADRIYETEYKQTQEITSIKGYEDGQILDCATPTIEFDDPSNEVCEFSWDQETKTGLITGVKQGSANLKVSFTTSTGEEYVKRFAIKVNLPIYEVNEPIEYFSIEDGKYVDSSNNLKSLQDLFETGSKRIIKATQDDNVLTVDNDKVMGVISPISTGFGDANVTIYNGSYGLKLTLKAAQKVVSTADDLTNIFASGKTLKGYYALHNDIKGETLSMPNNKTVGNFAGIFDGLGHVISVTLKHAKGSDQFGLFGNELAGTIKNIAFDKCEADSSESGFIAHHAGNGAYIEDVYLNSYINSTNNSTRWGCFYSTYGYLKAARFVIYSEKEYSNQWGSGVLGVHRLDAASSDVIIVSKNEIGTNATFKSFDSEWAKSQDESTVPTKIVLVGTNKVNNYEILKGRQLNYSNFSEAIWDLSLGYPVFKGL